jgi:hypothetical protein
VPHRDASLASGLTYRLHGSGFGLSYENGAYGLVKVLSDNQKPVMTFATIHEADKYVN